MVIESNLIYNGNTGIKIDTFPEVVGYWKMPGGDGVWSVKFSAYKRPRWLTIKMMWLVFEWKWEDK